MGSSLDKRCPSEPSALEYDLKELNNEANIKKLESINKDHTTLTEIELNTENNYYYFLRHYIDINIKKYYNII